VQAASITATYLKFLGHPPFAFAVRRALVYDPAGGIDLGAADARAFQPGAHRCKFTFDPLAFKAD